jgi:hypothetical protein
MTPGAAWPIPVIKEARALLPLWAACMLAVGARALGGYVVPPVAVVAYALGGIVLGAQSVGHEYTYRTLGLLLAQPVSRGRLFLTKAAVLAIMLLTLTLLASVSVFDDRAFTRALGWLGGPALLVPAMLGMLVAPWITMLCRNVLAGVVFTITLPALLLIAADVLSVAVLDLNSAAAIDDFKRTMFWWGTIGLSAAGAVGSWWSFSRLEAIDGRGADIQLPSWVGGVQAERAPADRSRIPRRGPVRALLGKEVRLQQMTFVVALLFVSAWLVLSTLERMDPERNFALSALTVLYLGLLSLLIGALASAEERQMGTLEWQVLLPIAWWKQWSVKAAGAIGLALLLGVAVPLVLGLLSPSGDGGFTLRGWMAVSALVVMLTSLSLYVSSLSSSGVRALVSSLPLVAAAMAGRIWWEAARAVGAPYYNWYSFPEPVAILAAGALMAILLLWLASTNHRTADRSLTRILRQAALIAGVIVVALVAPVVVLLL